MLILRDSNNFHHHVAAIWDMFTIFIRSQCWTLFNWDPGVYLVTYKMCVHACVWGLNRQPLSLFKQRTSITATFALHSVLVLEFKPLYAIEVILVLLSNRYFHFDKLSSDCSEAHLPKWHILVAKRFWRRKSFVAWMIPQL